MYANEAVRQQPWNRRPTGMIAGVLGAATALALTAVGHAGATARAPFSASFSGAAAFTSPATAVFTGAGWATHMGRSTSVGEATVTAPPDAPGCIPNANTETFTAADGAELVIRSDDLACPIGPGAVLGVGKWVVVSGTGRFAGATGSGSLDGVSDFGAGTFDVSRSGSLSLG
jgi:hypothetical protein